MEYYEQYQEMNRLLSLLQNSEEYIKTLMNSEEFEAYFLLKNSQFKDKSKWEPGFSAVFFRYGVKLSANSNQTNQNAFTRFRFCTHACRFFLVKYGARH